MKILGVIISFLLVLFIGGCTTMTATINFSPAQHPDEGLVVASFNRIYPNMKWKYRNLNTGKGIRGFNEKDITLTDEVGEVKNNLIPVEDRVIYSFELKPGHYEFFRWTAFFNNIHGESSKDFSIRFDVTAGKVTYIGNIAMFVDGRRFAMMEVGNHSVRIGIRDDSKTDIPAFLSRYKKVSKSDVVTHLAKIEK